MGCRETWFQQNADTCMNAVGFIDKQVIPLEDAWYVEYRYSWNTETHDRYYLINKLKGIDQHITQQQAQTQENIERDWNHITIDDSQARELAVELGLAKAS